MLYERWIVNSFVGKFKVVSPRYLTHLKLLWIMWNLYIDIKDHLQNARLASQNYIYICRQLIKITSSLPPLERRLPAYLLAYHLVPSSGSCLKYKWNTLEALNSLPGNRIIYVFLYLDNGHIFCMLGIILINLIIITEIKNHWNAHDK